MLRQLHRQDLREQDQPRLAHAVGAEAGQPFAAGDRRDVDDASALALVDEGTGGGLRDEERAGEVGVDDAAPLRLLQLGQGHAVVSAGGGGVVHQDVDPPQLAPDFLHQALRPVGYRDVYHAGYRATVQRPPRAGDGDVGALASER